MQADENSPVKKVEENEKQDSTSTTTEELKDEETKVDSEHHGTVEEFVLKQDGDGTLHVTQVSQDDEKSDIDDIEKEVSNIFKEKDLTFSKLLKELEADIDEHKEDLPIPKKKESHFKYENDEG